MVLGALWAAGLPLIAHLIPWRFETHLSSLTAPSAFEACANPAVQTVVQRIYPLTDADRAFPLTVTVLKAPVVNAYAGFGGHVYVNQGLIQQAESADELAGVLAHEIEHVRRRHIMEGILARLFTVGAWQILFSNGQTQSQAALRWMLTQRFTRAQERDADIGGFERLRDAHVDTLCVAHFFERIAAESSHLSFLSDHPAGGDRAALARRYQSSAPQPVMTPDEWKAAQAVCS